jgi:hypothetical protein
MQQLLVTIAHLVDVVYVEKLNRAPTVELRVLEALPRNLVGIRIELWPCVEDLQRVGVLFTVGLHLHEREVLFVFDATVGAESCLYLGIWSWLYVSQ